MGMSAMTERIEFLVPLPPVALRRNRLTRNNAYARKLRREYSEAVWIAGQRLVETLVAGGYVQSTMTCPPAVPWERVRLVLTWRHHRVGPDVPNVIDNCKALIDTLRCQQPSDTSNPKFDTQRYWLGLFRDDSPDCLVAVEPRVEKVRSKAEEGVLVSIERVDEHEFCHGDFHRCDGGGPGLADRYGDA